MGKFHGVMMPITPIGSRVISTSTPGRTEAPRSPASRTASPAKNRKIMPARATSAIPSGRVLPSSRANSRPISSRRCSSSLPTASSRLARISGDVVDQAGNARRAAATAASVWRESACAYSPTTSSRSDGFRFTLCVCPATHAPSIRLSNFFVIGLVLAFSNHSAIARINASEGFRQVGARHSSTAAPGRCGPLG